MFKSTASVALVLGVALSGCGSVDQADPEAKPSARPTATTAPLDDSLTEETPPSADDEATAANDDGVATFGEKYDYEDGLSIKVSKPGRYTPDEYADFRKGDKSFIQLTVTVLNDTGKVYDPTGLFTSATTGEREAQEVYDETMGSGLSTKILPGKTKMYSVAYGVDRGKDFVLQVSPGYTEDDESEYTEILFAS